VTKGFAPFNGLKPMHRSRGAKVERATVINLIGYRTGDVAETILMLKRPITALGCPTPLAMPSW
jgi:hypothetical protein